MPSRQAEHKKIRIPDGMRIFCIYLLKQSLQ